MKKKFLSLTCCTVFFMMICVQTSAAPLQPFPTVAQMDATQYVTQSSEVLWQQYYEAEANKKLLEMKTQPLHEQIKWAEQMGDYTQWMTYKQQEYNFKSQKEQYEFQKKQAEYQLTLLGEIQRPHERVYALYDDETWAETSFAELQMQKEALRLQEEKWELEKKTLEYTYRLGEVGDSAFLTQYQEILRQKQEIKQQRETIDAQCQLLSRWSGMGPASG